jgi:hypothetical protein
VWPGGGAPLPEAESTEIFSATFVVSFSTLKLARTA